MSDARWKSPFPHTLSFELFREHFTELNNIYWSFVPASNTILSLSKKSLTAEDADPKSYFLIPDKDDKRIATTFGKWQSNFKEFGNYTRLSLVMMLSSCFETYLRTVVSNAFESCPGVIIMCPKSVDGAFLLKKDIRYGDASQGNYQFVDQIKEICSGTWSKRIQNFEKYFGTLPGTVHCKISDLDKFRNERNEIGHYFGRTKKEYTAPLVLNPVAANRVSHEKLLKYFSLIYGVAVEIDGYLKDNFIGSYDIIKFYLYRVVNGEFSTSIPGIVARELQKVLGSNGFPPVGNEYYRNIVSYCSLDAQSDVCKYSKKSCIKEINRQLSNQNISLLYNGHNVRFGKYYFDLFVRVNNWRNDPEYCQRNQANSLQVEYRYSSKIIDSIVKMISTAPETIISTLKASAVEPS